MNHPLPLQVSVSRRHRVLQGYPEILTFFVEFACRDLQGVAIECESAAFEPVHGEAEIDDGASPVARAELQIMPLKVGSHPVRFRVTLNRRNLVEVYETGVAEGIVVDPRPDDAGPVNVKISNVHRGDVGKMTGVDSNAGATLDVGGIHIANTLRSIKELHDELPGESEARLRLRRKAATYLPRQGILDLTLIGVQPGQFQMGAPQSDLERMKSERRHLRTLEDGYWISDCPITRAQYREIMGEDPSSDFGGRLGGGSQSANHPVQNIDWFQAVEFCRRLTERARSHGGFPWGFAYRLPTEAEWERACRGEHLDEPRYSDFLERIANVDAQFATTTPVGKFAQNSLGLYDMLGNVFEWCLDEFRDYDPNYETDRPAEIMQRALASDAMRVVRGGSWKDAPVWARASARGYSPPDKTSSRIGFRVVLAREITATRGD